jgi:nucleoid-associated protein YgaU
MIMSVKRNKNRTILENGNEAYRELLFERRGEVSITHYGTPNPMRDPTVREMSSMEVHTHTWRSNDRLWKLADEAYGDPTYWWVIARYNKKPTEAHFKLGEVIEIPQPLSSILAVYGVY